MSNKKKKKNYTYNGLGFPVVIEEAELRKVGDKWLLKVDIEKLSDEVMKVLPAKPGGLTGAEIRFMRTYFGLSRRSLASELNVSHTAVNKWEETGNERAKIDPHVEIMFRALMKLMLHQESDFLSFFKSMMTESKKFSELKNKPLNIAI